jgi:hypothetical protein
LPHSQKRLWRRIIERLAMTSCVYLILDRNCKVPHATVKKSWQLSVKRGLDRQGDPQPPWALEIREYCVPVPAATASGKCWETWEKKTTAGAAESKPWRCGVRRASSLKPRTPLGTPAVSDNTSRLHGDQTRRIVGK